MIEAVLLTLNIQSTSKTAFMFHFKYEHNKIT